MIVLFHRKSIAGQSAPQNLKPQRLSNQLRSALNPSYSERALAASAGYRWSSIGNISKPFAYLSMKLKRSGWITDEEAMALLDGMEEKNVLRFPLEVSEATAVVNTVKRYDRNAERYKPHLLEVLRSKLNFSYASITMFVLWFQPGELKLSIVQCKKQRVKLEVKLAENSTPDWEKMRLKGMVRWFKY